MRKVSAVFAESQDTHGARQRHPMDTLQVDKPASADALEILTRKQLADRLKCSTRHLDAQVGRGMPSLMLGRTRRFILPEVVAWLRRQSR